MMHYIDLFRVEAERRFNITRRYPLNLIFSIIMSCIILYSIIAGSRYFSDGILSEDKVLGTTVSYFVWLFSLGIYNTASDDIAEDAKLGCLEQIIVSKYHLMSILLVRKLVGLTSFFVTSFTAFLLATYLLDIDLNLHLNQLLPLFFIILTSIGLSYLLGAVTFFSKEMHSISSIVQLVMIGFFLYPFENLQNADFWIAVTPYASAMEVMRSVSIGASIYQYGSELLIATINSLVIILIGCTAFSLMYNRAKSQGIAHEH